MTVDVGANLGLYTRELSRLSKKVYAFEPSHKMADLLRRTSASNVSIHEIALSDKPEMPNYSFRRRISKWFTGLLRSSPSIGASSKNVVSVSVPNSPSGCDVHQNVAFVKIDVEGHELSVLNGAVGLLEQSQPVFLVEAEDRHRSEATRSIFEFFEKRAYKGFFLKEGSAVPVRTIPSRRVAGCKCASSQWRP